MNFRGYFWFLFVFLPITLMSQDVVLPLYPEGIPCANELREESWEVGNTGRRIQKVNEPTLATYLTNDKSGLAPGVVICPGGGYTVLAYDWEGTRMAEWFNSLGVNAFVLKYRLPRWESVECRSKVALLDAQRAMRLVRMNASDWKTDPERVGVMGFSAGGHLASTLSTHFDGGDQNSAEKVNTYGCRPDFSILMYPVISMDTAFGHTGSRRNLIGTDADSEMELYFSNEKQVSAETPPTILIHASDDRGVVPENSIAYYRALLKNNVSAALHIYEGGGHGFSFAEGLGSVADWPKTCKTWMKNQGLLQNRLSALIIDGQNNHVNWMDVTEIMKNHLMESGLFSVDIARTGPVGYDINTFNPDFSKYDLVISNYSNYKGDPWSQKTMDAFEKYMRNGGGFITVHAADNAFPDWKAYNEMIGLGGWLGRTEAHGPYVYYDKNGELIRDESPGPGGHHGDQHEFLIEVRDSAHPIMQGLPTSWMHARDELYDMMRGPAINMQILATAFSSPDIRGTDRHEPVMMALHYGLGRIFHTTLGHNNESVEHIGFKVTLQRAAEWVATGKVTQEVPDDFR